MNTSTQRGECRLFCPKNRVSSSSATLCKTVWSSVAIKWVQNCPQYLRPQQKQGDRGSLNSDCTRTSMNEWLYWDCCCSNILLTLILSPQRWPLSNRRYDHTAATKSTNVFSSSASSSPNLSQYGNLRILFSALIIGLILTVSVNECSQCISLIVLFCNTWFDICIIIFL